jgi:arsenical pump membrane protein
MRPTSLAHDRLAPVWQIIWLAAGVVAVLTSAVGRSPRWILPGLVAAGTATGVVSWRLGVGAVRDLAGPLAFLVAAVPLAMALDRMGFFEAVAQRVSNGRAVHGPLWVLATVVTAVLNLDASIVLLTPLYLRIAERRGLPPLSLALQPMLLAALASSALPVSNLTNLIVAERLGASTVDFLTHLGPSTLVGSGVGWFVYRRAFPQHPREPVPTSVADAHPSRVLLIGGSAVSVLLVGFTFGEPLGVQPWMVAGAVVLALSAVTRWRPWKAIPVDAVVIAASLGVLAASAAARTDLSAWLGREGFGGRLTAAALALMGANLVNNLPALLVAADAAGPQNIWPILAAVNVGPVLWISGSLAGLLWLDLVRRHQIALDHLGYARLGWRLGAVPALAAVLLAAR